MEHFFAGGFLYNPETKSVLLHKRDGNTNQNPYKWAFFGGAREGQETPRECCSREWKEELNIEVKPEDLILLCDYLNTERNVWRYSFYIESQMKKSEMTLGEGADFDWIPLDKVSEYDLSSLTRRDLEFFMKNK